jgi:excisionase family DNA binding protein
METPKNSTPSTKYRLAADQAAVIRANPPSVMTIKESAAYLCISTRKLRDLINARRIKSARLGAKIVIKREYLDEAISVAA